MIGLEAEEEVKGGGRRWRKRRGGDKARQDANKLNLAKHKYANKLPSICSTIVCGRKYFVTALHDSKVFTFFVDSGADISIIPTHLAKGLPQVSLDEPLEVNGFDGSHRFSVTHRVDLSLSFHPGDLQASFFICDVPHAIIGADLLQKRSASLDF